MELKHLCPRSLCVWCPPWCLARLPSGPLVSPLLPAQTTLTAASPLAGMLELSPPTPLVFSLLHVPTIPTALLLLLDQLAMSILLVTLLVLLLLPALTSLTATRPHLLTYLLPFLHKTAGTQASTNLHCLMMLVMTQIRETIVDQDLLHLLHSEYCSDTLSDE